MGEIDNINSLENNPKSDKTFKDINIEMNAGAVMDQLYKIIQEGWPSDKKKIYNSLLPYWNIKENLHTQHDIIFQRDRMSIPLKLKK